jgi:transposase-like protein
MLELILSTDVKLLTSYQLPTKERLIMAHAGTRYSLETKLAACKMYQTATGAEVCAKYGVSIATLCTWRKKLGFVNKYLNRNLAGNTAVKGLIVKQIDLQNRKFTAALAEKDEKIRQLETRIQRILDVAMQVNV